MQNNTFTFALALLLVAAALTASAAEPGVVATNAPSSATASSMAMPVRVSPMTTSSQVDGFGPSVAAATLATLSGGTAVTEQMTLTGTVSNNTDDHVMTGFNSISDGAFNGATGVPMVIQNTGNNVLIQNATIINVQFQP